MKKLFTLTLSLLTIASTGLEARTEREAYPKPEVRKMDFREHPLTLRSGELSTRADDKPFPDSTMTYNLKGEPIAKENYVYNKVGKELSYRSYTKDGKATVWTDNEKRERTFDSAGRELTYESSNWDASQKRWIGEYKYKYAYDSSGREILYESYTWDSSTADWYGFSKLVTDYETGNRRVTDYEWRSDTKSWSPDKRHEYVSETMEYLEYMGSDGNWSYKTKIVKENVVNLTQSGVTIIGASIELYKEKHLLQDSDGNWDEKNAWFSISGYFTTLSSTWHFRGYEDYNIAYDDAGNVTSVVVTAGNGNTFQIDYAYDFSISKVNSASVYRNGVLVDKQSCIYDTKERVIERSKNYEEDNVKYAYTYIGDSNVRNSIEYYLWDSAKKVFVKESKNMYVKNAAGRNTMHQTYSWAETKWVLSSYTIYYPNEYTSDLEIEEAGQVGSDNKGSFNVGFSLPQDAEVTGSFYITLPKGFVLDETSTVLSDDLAKKYTITITPQEGKNTWFVEIKEKSLRNASTDSGPSYKQILTIAYTVDATTKQGNYAAKIENLNFLLTDGTSLIEQNRDVTISVIRYGVSNESISGIDMKVFTAGGYMHITSPYAETVSIYNLLGQLVYRGEKLVGEYRIPVSGWDKGLYIVKGSKSITAKTFVGE